MDGNKWRAVQGKSPTKRDLASWTEKQFIFFLQFCLFFITYSEDGKESKVSVTKEKWKNAEGFLAMEGHPFQEFLFRINKFTFDADGSEKKFYFKLISMMKFVLGYLRVNPGLISDEMKKLIEPHPRLNWCLHQFRVADSPAGPIVVPDTMQRVGEVHTLQPIAAIELQVAESLIKVVSLLNLVAASITPEELKKLDTKDKLLAIGRLLPVYNITKNFKPNKQIFKSLVINNAKREDIEAAMFDLHSDD